MEEERQRDNRARQQQLAVTATTTINTSASASSASLSPEARILSASPDNNDERPVTTRTLLMLQMDLSLTARLAFAPVEDAMNALIDALAFFHVSAETVDSLSIHSLVCHFLWRYLRQVWQFVMASDLLCGGCCRAILVYKSVVPAFVAAGMGGLLVVAVLFLVVVPTEVLLLAGFGEAVAAWEELVTASASRVVPQQLILASVGPMMILLLLGTLFLAGPQAAPAAIAGLVLIVVCAFATNAHQRHVLFRTVIQPTLELIHVYSR